MSIEKTKAGTYRARWRDDSGRDRAKTFRLKGEAQAFLDQTRTDLARGTYVAPAGGRTTVAQWADEWLAGAMNLGQGGQDTYRRDLDRYILPALGDLTLRQLTAGAISEFLSAELGPDPTRTAKPDGLAPSTVHRHYRTIRRMMEVAVTNGKIAKNPCEPVTPPTIPHEEMRFLAVAEVDAIADNIGPRYRVWVFVAAYGGLRWSETVGLRRSAIDGDRLIVTEQMIRRSDDEWHRDAPKTRAGRRTVTLPAFLVDELGPHLEQFAQPGADGLVFPNQLGSPMNGSSFRGNVFKPAWQRAGISPAIRVHDLRHTAVALAVLAGAHPKAIQARMGHASISVTLDRYGHLFPEMDGQIAQGLDRLRSPDEDE